METTTVIFLVSFSSMVLSVIALKRAGDRPVETKTRPSRAQAEFKKRIEELEHFLTISVSGLKKVQACTDIMEAEAAATTTLRLMGMKDGPGGRSKVSQGSQLAGVRPDTGHDQGLPAGANRGETPHPVGGSRSNLGH